MSELKQPWDKKYQPQTLSEYIFQNPQDRVIFQKMVDDGRLPTNLLLTGVQGTGKTTLAEVLVKDLKIDHIDFLYVKASKENSVDVMRETITEFVGSYPIGDYKVVLLDEADLISFTGQGVLRNLLDESIATGLSRFILTGNYDYRFIPAIKSRVQQYHFKAHDKNDVTELVAKILLAEKIKFDLDLLDKYVNLAYPDIRKIIILLEQHSTNGVLEEPLAERADNDYRFLMTQYLTEGKWDELRDLLYENVATEEWEEVYRFLYENLNKAPVFKNDKYKWEEGIVTIAEYMHRNMSVFYPDINFAACVIKLKQIVG